jgi:hypothetical protein
VWVTALLVFATAAAAAGWTTDVSVAGGLARPISASSQGIVEQTSEERLSARRSEARAHMDAEKDLFSTEELAEIEALYSSAHESLVGFVRGSEGQAILQMLIQRYPRSNRAGCAVLELARRASGAERARQLRVAIANHSSARFENGVQVGAMARAMLAVHLAGTGQFDEAERLANEVDRMFPGAIDERGASLNGLAESIRLLRSPKVAVSPIQANPTGYSRLM